MHNKLLRLRQVEEITGLSRSSIYRRMKDRRVSASRQDWIYRRQVE